MERISHQRKLEQARNLAKNIFYVFSIIFSITIGYYFGLYSYKLKSQNTPKQLEIVIKKNVSIGTDEKNNLIIINKSIGTCTVYEDSVGYNIFNLYAKKILNQ